MNGWVRWGAAGVILGLAVALTLPSFAQPVPSESDGDVERAVTVSGIATIRSDPDEAVVGLGVQTEAPTARQAMEQNAVKMRRVIEALLEQGIHDDDVATSSINLYPSYSEDGQAATSFLAENQVNVTVADLSAVGRIIDEAVAAGANLASGLTFGLSDENAAVERALEAAVADARSKAEVLAGAADAGLGRVVRISEMSQSPGPVILEEGAVADAATPVSPPTLETQVSVTVVWELI